jgi:hypothetical protein
LRHRRYSQRATRGVDHEYDVPVGHDPVPDDDRGHPPGPPRWDNKELASSEIGRRSWRLVTFLDMIVLHDRLPAINYSDTFGGADFGVPIPVQAFRRL